MDTGRKPIKRKKSSRKPKPTIKNIEPVNRLKKSFTEYFSTALKIIGIIVLFFGFYQGCDFIYSKYFKSKREQFIDENYYSGILLPNTIDFDSDAKGTIKILCGRVVVNVNRTAFVDGYKYNTSNEVGLTDGRSLINLSLKIMNQRLYISSTFKDLDDNVVGIIEDNYWRLLKRNMIDWKSDNNNFEVIDNHNDVIFRMSFIYPNSIRLSGYVLSRNQIAVINDNGIEIYPRDISERTIVLDSLATIKKFFNYSK